MGTGNVNRGPGRTILVVEDNADSRDALVSMLELMGHKTYGAATGVRGLDMALRLRPDVLVIDLVGLPELNGVELTRQLRRRGDGYHPVIIAFSGAHLEAERAVEAGCDAFVLKPDVNGLLHMLADASLDALRQRRHPGEAGNDARALDGGFLGAVRRGTAAAKKSGRLVRIAADEIRHAAPDIGENVEPSEHAIGRTRARLRTRPS